MWWEDEGEMGAIASARFWLNIIYNICNTYIICAMFYLSHNPSPSNIVPFLYYFCRICVGDSSRSLGDPCPKGRCLGPLSVSGQSRLPTVWDTQLELYSKWGVCVCVCVRHRVCV